MRSKRVNTLKGFAWVLTTCIPQIIHARILMPATLLTIATAAVAVAFLFVEMNELPRLVCQLIIGTATCRGLSFAFLTTTCFKSTQTK